MPTDDTIPAAELAAFVQLRCRQLHKLAAALQSQALLDPTSARNVRRAGCIDEMQEQCTALGVIAELACSAGRRDIGAQIHEMVNLQLEALRGMAFEVRVCGLGPSYSPSGAATALPTGAVVAEFHDSDFSAFEVAMRGGQ